HWCQFEPRLPNECKGFMWAVEENCKDYVWISDAPDFLPEKMRESTILNCAVVERRGSKIRPTVKRVSQSLVYLFGKILYPMR
ncbi:MAG TPA: hypothetical protein PLB32_27265, partial [Acidobacteriota bacterium]|nr:hypothetical protein [Acidobacteriota bacterium]